MTETLTLPDGCRWYYVEVGVGDHVSVFVIGGPGAWKYMIDPGDPTKPMVTSDEAFASAQEALDSGIAALRGAEEREAR